MQVPKYVLKKKTASPTFTCHLKITGVKDNLYNYTSIQVFKKSSIYKIKITERIVNRTIIINL